MDGRVVSSDVVSGDLRSDYYLYRERRKLLLSSFMFMP
jgi:hypothetical protein